MSQGLPGDAQQLSTVMEFSFCTKQPIMIFFLAYPFLYNFIIFMLKFLDLLFSCFRRQGHGHIQLRNLHKMKSKLKSKSDIKVLHKSRLTPPCKMTFYALVRHKEIPVGYREMRTDVTFVLFIKFIRK